MSALLPHHQPGRPGTTAPGRGARVVKVVAGRVGRGEGGVAAGCRPCRVADLQHFAVRRTKQVPRSSATTPVSPPEKWESTMYVPPGPGDRPGKREPAASRGRR